MKKRILNSTSRLFLILVLLFSIQSNAQLFTENIGNGSGTQSIAATTFQNTGFAFSGTADTRSTGVSDYSGASAGKNVFFTNVVGREFVISGINTSTFTSLVLSFGHNKNTTAGNNELIVEVGTNGISYSPLSYSRPTGSGTANWVLITASGTIPSTSNLYIRFRQTSSTTQFRIDDIALTGTLITSEPTITTSVTSLTDFGNVNTGANSTSQNFTVSGSDLTNNVSISASTDYQVSLDNSTFNSGFTLTQSSGTLAGQPVTIYVRYSPTTTGLNSGQITLSSADATTKTVSVSGTGIVPIISEPTAINASTITSNSFDANWNAVSGATSYRLDVSTSPTFMNLVPTTDLIISEYVEGSASNKYIEIYNGTGSSVNLSDYQLRLFANGAATATTTAVLNGTIANGTTIVYENSSAIAYGGAATSSSAVNFNGDDAVALFKISTSSYVDIFGSIGTDPGTAWTNGGNTTLDKTLVRNSNVSSGLNVNPGSTFPTLGTQWTQYNIDDVSHLGSHVYNATAPSFVAGYENLTVNATSQLVSGLQENTTYYYRVRAFDGTTSINSNVISVTTLVKEPTFTAISQDAIVCQGTQGSFTITGLLPNTTSNIGYTIDNGITQYFTNVISDIMGNATVNLFLAAAYNGQNLTVVSVERTDLTATTLITNFSITLAVQLNTTYYADADNDGYGDDAISIESCVFVTGYVTIGGDCNDNNAAVNPLATEVCYDGLDNNCDGTIDEGCVPIVSVVQGAQCGSTLATIDQYIYANLVSGAQGYRFRVTDMSTNQVQTIDKALRVFQLTQLTNYAFNRMYQVEVSVRKFNVWQPFYGAPCTVTTPATTTQVRAIQCSSTLTAMSNVIYADNVPFATGYRFRVVNTLTSNTQVLDRTLREFRMNLLTSPEYNTLYTVEVAIRNTDGTYLPYGPICNITTPEFPTTFLQNSQCDYTAVSNNETFYAVSYTGATTYRFRFINAALSYSYTFDKALRTFNLSEVPGLQPATTYSVQVSIELNGEFGPYGKVCSLTTPGTVAITRTTEKVVPFTAVAYPNPYAESFNLNVTTSSDANISITVYDMIGKQIEVRQVSASAINTIQIGDRYPSGVYNVIVTQGETSQNVRVIKR